MRAMLQPEKDSGRRQEDAKRQPRGCAEKWFPPLIAGLWVGRAMFMIRHRPVPPSRLSARQDIDATMGTLGPGRTVAIDLDQDGRINP